MLYHQGNELHIPMELPIKCSVWLESPNIEVEGKKILPQIIDIEPIMGSHRKIIEVHNPTIIAASRRSRMRLDQYLSTLFNLAYAKEFAYRDMCQYKYGGKTEVTVPGIGRIDVLTDDRVIEVKNIQTWKGGLGQVLSYSEFYPNHTPTLALTPNSKSNYSPELIEKICNKFGVEVVFL